VVAFLKGIPQDVLAKASLRSKAYTRALMHFEAYILENKEDIQDHLSFLQVTLSPTTASRLPVRHILIRES
jgi:serine/threonine-protein kinase ATR